MLAALMSPRFLYASFCLFVVLMIAMDVHLADMFKQNCVCVGSYIPLSTLFYFYRQGQLRRPASHSKFAIHTHTHTLTDKNTLQFI